MSQLDFFGGLGELPPAGASHSFDRLGLTEAPEYGRRPQSGATKMAFPHIPFQVASRHHAQRSSVPKRLCPPEDLLVMKLRPKPRLRGSTTSRSAIPPTASSETHFFTQNKCLNESGQRSNPCEKWAGYMMFLMLNWDVLIIYDMPCLSMVSVTYTNHYIG